MTRAQQELGLLPKLVVGTALAMLVAAAIWYPPTYENIHRMWGDLFSRPDGPMSFRFLLQPAMAILAALYDGMADARAGRSPYFWTILHEPAERASRLNEGLSATARIILLGMIMDAVYQFRVFGTFYPFEALLTAVALAFIPYLLLRGPIARVARWWTHRQRADPPGHWG